MGAWYVKPYGDSPCSTSCLRPAGSEPREDPPRLPRSRARLLPATRPRPSWARSAAGGRPGRVSRLVADSQLGVVAPVGVPRLVRCLRGGAKSLMVTRSGAIRHLSEISQGLRRASGDVGLTFAPHLTPMIRPVIHTTSARVADRSRSDSRLFERYADEPFVDVMPAGSHPETRSVRGANVCRIAVHRPPGRRRPGGGAVVSDNLVRARARRSRVRTSFQPGLDEAWASHMRPLLP